MVSFQMIQHSPKNHIFSHIYYFWAKCQIFMTQNDEVMSDLNYMYHNTIKTLVCPKMMKLCQISIICNTIKPGEYFIFCDDTATQHCVFWNCTPDIKQAIASSRQVHFEATLYQIHHEYHFFQPLLLVNGKMQLNVFFLTQSLLLFFVWNSSPYICNLSRISVQCLLHI